LIPTRTVPVLQGGYVCLRGGLLSKIGGRNKTVEIDESKFTSEQAVKGQWVFGGIESESGNLFPVPVQDRSADTLMAVISDWIEPGTTVFRDCWAAYQDLEAHGYTHQTVNHTIAFVDERTGLILTR
jgi:transposase-like protein